MANMRNHSRFFLAVLCLSLAPSGGGSMAGDAVPPDWEMVWSDEFSDTSVDRAKWTLETGGGGWGNNELQYYTDGGNVNVQNGYLTITARPQDYGGRHYTSARLVSKGKAFWTYGRVEARIRLPFGQGMWPAFWMLGQSIDTVGFPQCGEIDIVEMVGGNDQDGGNRNAVVWSSLHRPNQDPDPATQVKSFAAAYRNPANADFSDAFHVFGVEWDAGSIKYQVDGNVYQAIDISANADGFEVFKQPFFIVLTLAVGGDWPGAPDQTTVWPQQMQIDWVRVYQRR